MHTRQPTRALTRLALSMALCGACALASVALAGGASAIVPPPGTPDLSQMVLAPSDFAPGARVTWQGYFREKGFGANYERNFAASTTVGGAKFAGVSSQVYLAHDASEATLVFAASKGRQRSPSRQRRVIAQSVAREVRQCACVRAHVRPQDIRFGPIRSLGVGDGSFLLPMSIRVHGMRFSVDLINLRVDRALGGLDLIGVPRTTISPGDATSLAGKMADHMRTALSPLNSVAPVIGGTATQGQTLVASSGTWSNGPTGFAYQWQRRDAAGANCTPIAGASGQSYTLTAADVGARLRVSVTATGTPGLSATANSTPTAIVQ
jgi:hypothetical protein